MVEHSDGKDEDHGIEMMFGRYPPDRESDSV